jgi:hypothetical protein
MSDEISKLKIQTIFELDLFNLLASEPDFSKFISENIVTYIHAEDGEVYCDTKVTESFQHLQSSKLIDRIIETLSWYEVESWTEMQSQFVKSLQRLIADVELLQPPV